MQYLIAATAHWIAGSEGLVDHVDRTEKKSTTFIQIIPAANERLAREEAQKLLAEFIKTLPAEHKGSMSWNSKPVITASFAKILKFSLSR